MTGVATDWTPDPFATQFERRDDGSLHAAPRARAARRIRRDSLDSLEHWARVAPDRVLVARRGVDGAWRTVSYAQMLAQAQRLAAGLAHAQAFCRHDPSLILSGNSIEHFTLGLAAMWAGIPYCPVSPAYSQVAGDLARLRYVMELLTPGLVAAFDTPRFARALSCVTCGRGDRRRRTVARSAGVDAGRARARRRRARGASARGDRRGFDREIPADVGLHRPAQGGDHHQPHVLQQCRDAAPVHAVHHAANRRCCSTGCRGIIRLAAATTWAWC